MSTPSESTTTTSTTLSPSTVQVAVVEPSAVATVSQSCVNPPVIAPLRQYYPTGECADPCMLGMNQNRGLLDYTFGSMLNTKFCGRKLPRTCVCAGRGCNQCISQRQFMEAGTTPFPDYDCEACPCAASNQSCMYPNSRVNAPMCDYGFARDPRSFQDPNGGNRNGNIRWG